MLEILVPRLVLPVSEMTLSDLDAEEMRLINLQTLRAFTKDEVFGRRCFVIHDGVTTQWSRFTAQSLDQIAGLLVGAPTVIAHREYDMTPLARTFRAQRLKRTKAGFSMVEGVGEGQWVQADFYWPKARSNAADLAIDIDAGIQREASLGFNFEKAICSICGDDLRECMHIPGQLYEDKRCFYSMLNVTKVREWSFVVRGAALRTEMGRLMEAERPAADLVEDLIKDLGIKLADEERDGLLQLALCYNSKLKLEKKKAGSGWYSALPKRAPLSWFQHR